MTFSHHGAAQSDKRSGRESKLIGSEQSCYHHVPTITKLSVCLHNNEPIILRPAVPTHSAAPLGRFAGPILWADPQCRPAVPTRWVDSLCRPAVPTRWADPQYQSAGPIRWADPQCRPAGPIRWADSLCQPDEWLNISSILTKNGVWINDFPTQYEGRIATLPAAAVPTHSMIHYLQP